MKHKIWAKTLELLPSKEPMELCFIRNSPVRKRHGEETNAWFVVQNFFYILWHFSYLIDTVQTQQQQPH